MSLINFRMWYISGTAFKRVVDTFFYPVDLVGCQCPTRVIGLLNQNKRCCLIEIQRVSWPAFVSRRHKNEHGVVTNITRLALKKIRKSSTVFFVFRCGNCFRSRSTRRPGNACRGRCFYAKKTKNKRVVVRHTRRSSLHSGSRDRFLSAWLYCVRRSGRIDDDDRDTRDVRFFRAQERREIERGRVPCIVRPDQTRCSRSDAIKMIYCPFFVTFLRDDSARRRTSSNVVVVVGE